MAGMRRGSSNAAALVAVLIVAVAAAAGAMEYCGVDLSAVEPCKPYCMVGSTQATPGQLCCDSVKSAKWSCLCKYRSFLPSGIDDKRIMDLASKCKTDYPPANCGAN